MIRREQFGRAVQQAEEYLSRPGLVPGPDEAASSEVTDFGLNELEN